MNPEELNDKRMAEWAHYFAALLLEELRKLATPSIKSFYTVREVAEALGKAPYTVREQWCNFGRIECVKDPSGKWLIPGHEYQRLLNGGLPKGRTFSASPLTAML